MSGPYVVRNGLKGPEIVRAIPGQHGFSIQQAFREAKRRAGWRKEVQEAPEVEAYLNMKGPGKKSLKELGW